MRAALSRPRTLTLASLGIALALGACAQLPTGPAGDSSTCNLEAAQPYVGTRWSADLLPPRDTPVRVARPGAMLTMDYLADRLTVHLDAEDRITDLRCG